jgi:uncharacterized membrane protein HdeD (DUF308 family)
MREYEEEDDRPEEYEPAPRQLPATVLTAGIVWILIGGLILLNGLITVVLLMATAGAPDAPAEAKGILAGGSCTVLLIALFGAAFILVGVQTVKGTAKDTLGNSIGSLVFGALVIAGGIVNMARGEVIPAGIGILAAAGLIAAGVLALIGRADYRAWRQAQQRARRR